MLLVTGFVSPIRGERCANSARVTQNETSPSTLIPAH
jgi:hypothetical protein